MPIANHLHSRLRSLYAKVDARAQELANVHAERLRCGRGCGSCCVDDITVNPVEADNIRSAYPDLLVSETPHAAGACAFLDQQGLCRIYDVRPYVCRTQGLPLHWIEELDDGTTAAMRDICPLNDTGTPVEQLAESECWIIGPFEEKLARLHFEGFGELSERVALRELFIDR